MREELFVLGNKNASEEEGALRQPRSLPYFAHSNRISELCVAGSLPTHLFHVEIVSFPAVLYYYYHSKS